MKKNWLIVLLSLSICMALAACAGGKTNSSADASLSLESVTDSDTASDTNSSEEDVYSSDTDEDSSGAGGGPLLQMFLITFTDENGVVVARNMVEEGELPIPPQMSVPENTDEYIYTGAWDKEIVPAEAAVTYVWVITATQNTKLSVTEFTEPVAIVGETLQAYMQASPDTKITDVFQDEGRRDQGKAVQIGYEFNNLPANVTVQHAMISLAETEDFISTVSYEYGYQRTSISLYNLKTGTQYYFRVDVTLSDGSSYSETGSFETLDTPRLMMVDGIFNVRDIGGWETVDGKEIRSGLLYRGTELEGAVEATYKLTPSGLQTMRNVLQIQTDIDLRNPSAVGFPTQSPLGSDVEYGIYNSVQYDGIFSDSGKETIRKIFSDLAKPEAYPVYLHCTYGCDRTGTVSMLLEGLLGVSAEDVLRDYELSGMFLFHVTRDYYGGTFLNQLLALEGETFQQKVEGYLLSAGVTSEEIATLKGIFLCEPTAEKHLVTFEGADVMPQLVLDGGMVLRPEIPTKAHPDVNTLYIFDTWYEVNADGQVGEKWNFGTPITNDTVIMAVFKEIPSKYMVTFKDADGNILQQSMVAYQTLPSFTADYPALPDADDGGSFMWLWDKEFEPVTAESEYTLVLTHKYQITFDGGDVVEYIHGAKLTPPVLEERAGYMFSHWEVNGEAVDLEQYIVTESADLISVWVEVITFTADQYGASVSDTNGGVVTEGVAFEGGLRYNFSTTDTEGFIYLPKIDYSKYASVTFDVKVANWTFFGPDPAFRHYSNTGDYEGVFTIVNYSGKKLLVSFSPKNDITQKIEVTNPAVINGTENLSCSVLTYGFGFVEISPAKISYDAIPTAVAEDGTLITAGQSDLFNGGLLYKIGDYAEQYWTVNLKPFNYAAYQIVTYEFQGTNTWMKICLGSTTNGIRNQEAAICGTMVFINNGDGTFKVTVYENTTASSVSMTLTDTGMLNGTASFTFLLKGPSARYFHISAPTYSTEKPEGPEGIDEDVKAVAADGTVVQATASSHFDGGLYYEIGNNGEQYWTITLGKLDYSSYETVTYEFQGTGTWMKICLGSTDNGIRNQNDSIRGTIVFTKQADGSFLVVVNEVTTGTSVSETLTDTDVIRGNVGYTFLVKTASSPRHIHISAPTME